MVFWGMPTVLPFGEALLGCLCRAGRLLGAVPKLVASLTH